tara:strand:+ start:665 stop:1012 length:348 start_codon:yes stop_codon:yes gene_type:complete
MDKTQMYIIKQSSIKTAADFFARCSNSGCKHSDANLEDVFKFADRIVDWVISEGVKTTNLVDDLPKIPDSDKKWLNRGTPEYSSMIEYRKKGGSVQQIRNQFKVSKEIEAELSKI